MLFIARMCIKVFPTTGDACFNIFSHFFSQFWNGKAMSLWVLSPLKKGGSNKHKCNIVSCCSNDHQNKHLHWLILLYLAFPQPYMFKLDKQIKVSTNSLKQERCPRMRCDFFHPTLYIFSHMKPNCPECRL